MSSNGQSYGRYTVPASICEDWQGLIKGEVVTLCANQTDERLEIIRQNGSAPITLNYQRIVMVGREGDQINIHYTSKSGTGMATFVVDSGNAGVAPFISALPKSPVAQGAAYAPPRQSVVSDPSPYGYWHVFFMCLFLGVTGMHRFFVRKTGTGVIWLLTLGCLGIGFLIDMIMIADGSFTDASGKKIMYSAHNRANMT